MAPATRSNPLDHILKVLNAWDDKKHPYHFAFESAGIATIDDLLSLSKEDLKSITWTDSLNVQKSLSIASINTLLSVASWFSDQDSTEDAVFLTLTPELLTAHRRSIAGTAPVFAPVPATSVSNAAVLQASTADSKLSPADEFKKGIKRDISAFKPLKERKQWNLWHRNFRATAKAQGLDSILDHTYIPSTPESQALFDVLQSYGFAVFTNTLHEAEASDLVRKYSGASAGGDEGNAQKLYHELVKLMSGGIAAETAKTDLELQIHAFRLDRNWNKSIVSFLTRFSHLVKDLHDLRDPGDTASYNDAWCISAIKSSLMPHHAMTSHINTMSSSRVALATAISTQGQTLPTHTFHEYLQELKNQAVLLDANFQRSHRQANSATSNTQDVTDPAVRLTDTEYAALTADQKKKRFERKAASRQVHSATTAPTSVAPPSTIAVPDSATVMSAVSTPVAPGTVLRQMMSTNAPRPSDASVDLTINGVQYRRANATHVYNVRDTCVSYSGALVDGGANGGLIGSDARILEVDLIATADVVGVTDDVMSSLPIVQAAARLETVSDGPIIAIFSSYAQRNDGGRTIHSKG